jgi:sporulation protein YlmC with PRC-barrel domain
VHVATGVNGRASGDTLTRLEERTREAAMENGHEQADQDAREQGDEREQRPAPEWNVAEWHGKPLVDLNGERIGKLEDVYVDVETDAPQFATVKEGLISRHLTFVPLGGISVGPYQLEVAVNMAQVQAAANFENLGVWLSQAD